MAKLVKKKKRKLRFEAFAFIVLVISVGLWLFSSLVIGSINTSLTIKIQQADARIASLKEENQTLSIQIQSLENKDRVYVIAQDAGLDQNQDNIISIIGD